MDKDFTGLQDPFEQLAQSLRSTNDIFQQSGASTTNKHVTCHNWLNSYYIVHIMSRMAAIGPSMVHFRVHKFIFFKC